MTAASTADTTAKTMVPSRVASTRLMRFMTVLSSSGHHGDASAEAGEVARLGGGAGPDAPHELDEVALDVAAGRHRVGAGVVESVAAARPPRHVEGAEVLH